MLYKTSVVIRMRRTKNMFNTCVSKKKKKINLQSNSMRAMTERDANINVKKKNYQSTNEIFFK